MQSLNSYLAYKASIGVEYYILDLKDQRVRSLYALDIDNTTAILNDIYDVAVPDYLMIVGDSTVVPNADWDNPCDMDETVPSDLPYLTLDTMSPWEGAIYGFENITQVGRIPAKTSDDFATAIKYFDNTKRFTGYGSARSFALSARVWEDTSRAEFAHLNPYLITSPEYTCNAELVEMDYDKELVLLGKLSGEYNLLCFNLHGSDEDHTWLGQRDFFFYPEAFEKSMLPDSDGYMLLTEACYGARPLANASIVVNALKNNCVAFVGSSRIAYGYGDGNLCCADVVAYNFTKGVAEGKTAGRAFLSALNALATPWIDEEEIKTMAEFALYGDPSITLIAGSGQKAAQKAAPAKRSVTTKDSSRGIKLMSCDEETGGRGAKGGLTMLSCSPEEQAHLKKMASVVSKSGNDYILQKFSAMGTVKPKVYKVMGKDEYRAVYTRTEGKVKTIVKMHLDGEGNVKKVYNSK